MRGQSAVEYMFIFGAVLAVFAAVTVPQMVNPAKEASKDAFWVSQARAAVDVIANAINGVYANSERAVMTEVVSLDGNWELQIDNDSPKLRLGIATYSGTEWVEENLRYGFGNLGLGGLDNSLSNIPSGSYVVIVEWTSEEAEGIDDSALDNDKIYIFINPAAGGGT